MHFHLPKPLHGWRQFAGEVGIIVLGVLIALGFEQLLSEINWRRETVAERQALNEDVADNLEEAQARQLQQHCIDRRLRELAIVFKQHAAGQPTRIQGVIGRPLFYTGSRATWQIAISSQALAHMPLPEKLEFSRAFSAYDNMDQVLNREQEAWLRLGMLNDPDQLQLGDWSVLHQAYAEASSLNARLQTITDDVLATKALGQKPKVSDEPPPAVLAAIKDLCSPILPKTGQTKPKS
jgi:hypothetical protein